MHAVALKLPEFWQEHAVWFAQAEAQFALRGITQEDTKYFYVVAALNSSTASRPDAGPAVRVVGAADVLAIRRMSSPLPSGSDLQRASATIMPAVKHGVDHFIATTGPPATPGARRLDPQKLAVAKAEFDSMERLGIVHDILVASVTSDEHQAHLRALLRASANTG
ncbi:hypothetical protein AAFF_G00275540 [Aldrovandia affinis]|uniref:DUF7041 domain-containing protein n=1 Tax=Aldrovandia affinis TaxID=143900 RepID=A0AAD7W2L3_9TELE|nr:hypothetical protein AAFF_G00275540 [Aldrovandia affinis]